MKTRSLVFFSCVLLWIGVFAVQLHASAPPPIIRGALSKNGQFLVVSSFELGPPDSHGGTRVIGFKFEVTRLQTFINRKDQLTSPNRYYSDVPGNCKVEIKISDHGPAFQRWPIISDDGRTLVLVGVTAPWPNVPLLEIYQQKGFDAALVRSFSLGDLRKTAAGAIYMQTDSTPQWFAGGEFSFAPSGQTLVYTDPQQGSFSINLTDGVVTRR